MKQATPTQNERQPEQKRRRSLLRRFGLALGGAALALALFGSFPVEATTPYTSTSYGVGLFANVQSLVNSSARFFSDVRFLYRVAQLRVDSAPARQIGPTAPVGPALQRVPKVQVCKLEVPATGHAKTSRTGL